MAGVVGPIRLDEAQEIAGMMVATGRAVPPARWVDSLRERARHERSRTMPHNLL